MPPEDNATAPTAAPATPEPAAAPEAVVSVPEPAVASEPSRPAATLLSEGDARAAEPAADAIAEPAKAETTAEAVPEVAAVEGEPKADAAATAEPAAAPVVTYEAFSFPEGMVVAPEDSGLAKFTEIAGAAGLPQETAQQLVSLYGEAAQKYAADLQEHLTQRQFDVFADTVTGWEKQFRDDPEFKNRVDTVVNDARWAIQQYGGTAEQIKETRDVLLSTGTGNHRAIIRLLANVAKALKEARPGPRPVPQNARGANPADRRYGNMAKETA